MSEVQGRRHQAPYRLVYILGAGHCGSTLLDMLLSGHSKIFAAGEVTNIHRYWAIAAAQQPAPVRSAQPGRRRDWLEVSSHPFESAAWQRAIRCYENTMGQPFDTVAADHVGWQRPLFRQPGWGRLFFRTRREDIAQWSRPQRVLFDCLHTATGAPIITDASKRPQRLYLLLRSGTLDLAVVHLIRDGRGIMYSFLRKYGRWGDSFRRWAGPTLMAFYLRRLAARVPWLDVRYEDLAQAPERTLIRICDFLSVSFEPEMLEFRSHPYLGIGGNRMREGQGGIRLDEQWKHDWRGPSRLAFAVAGGWLNRLCGY